MKSGTQHKLIIGAGILVLFLTPLIVFAIMLKTQERVNNFRPAKEETQIAENNGKPKETQENPLTWSESANEQGNYVSTKTVTVSEVSNPNGEYIRVRFVPSWYDDSGCVVSGVNGVTDIRTIELSGDKKHLLFITGGDSPQTTITLNLAEGWDDKWEYNTEKGYFSSKALVKSGEEIVLLDSVEIPGAVFNAAETEKIHLQLDVLADSVQSADEGGATVNPKWQ